MKKYPQYRRRMLAIVLTLFCFTSCNLCADIFQWIGSDSQRNGLFSDPTCWYPQTVPYHWDTAYFNQNQTYSVWFNNFVETWDFALHAGDVRFTPDTMPLFREYKFHHGTIAGGTLRVRAMKLAVTDYLDMWGLEVHAPTLIVEVGGTVVCGAMKLGGGNYNLSQGTMTIAGSNASVTAGSLRAGVEGTGEVNVFQGTLTVPDCIIGESDWGELNVVGGQSIFAGQTVTVGSSWAGLVEILNGAKASAITCSLGIRPDPLEVTRSRGTLIVDGAGSEFLIYRLDLGGSVAGQGGFGVVFIRNGGMLTVDRNITIWDTPANPIGRINRIELTDGTLIADEIILGNNTLLTTGSQSALRINRMPEPSTVELYRLETGHSIGSPLTPHTMQITGEWTIHDKMVVGLDSDMALQIQNMGQVSSLYGIIADQSGSDGAVTITGVNARWDNASHLYVGNNGNGTLTLQNGGDASCVFGYIGHHPGSSGNVLIDGLASRWQNTYLFIGDVPGSVGGSGQLTIQNSAQVNTLYNILVGDQGYLTVNNAVLRADEVELNGNGVLNIVGASELYLNELDAPLIETMDLQNSSLFVGHGTNLGRFTLGNQRTLVMEGTLNVGWDKPATMTISDGGQLMLNSTGSSYISRTNGIAGTLTVTDSGSAMISHGSLILNSINAQLNILNGASVSIANTLNISGTLNVNEGTLKAYRVIRQPSATVQSTGSTLQIALFEGNLQQNQGLLDVDWNGLMECTGDLTMNACTTQIEIGGTTPYSGHDVLKIGGNIHWSGVLKVLFKEGFIPRAGQIFHILEFDLNRQTGWFNQIVLPELPLPLVWNADMVYSAGQISISAEAFAIEWGKIYSGQTSIPHIVGTVEIAAGWRHGLMLDRFGYIWQWGSNPYGATPPTESDFVAIDAGGYFSLGLRQTHGTIVAWGNNAQGQCNVPAGSYKTMAAGWSHSVAIRTDGSLAGWGTNTYGEINVPTGTDFKAVAAGFNFSFALRNDGSLAAWGASSGGQLDIPAGTFIAVDAGMYHGIALKSDHSIVAWGYDYYGQVSQTPIGNDFVEIAAGSYHNLARRSDGSIVAWGKNDHGQAVYPQGNDAIHIAAGDDFSVMLTMQPPMPVLYNPTEGQVLTAGMPYAIQWKTWYPVQDIDIYYSINNGTTFIPVESSNNGDTGVYLWRVPPTPSTQCYLKIIERLNPDVSAISGQFEIRQPIFVDANAQGLSNGASWSDAYTSLQDALAAAGTNDVLWVASGTYLPDEGFGLSKGDRNLSFNLKSDVKLYGGFPSGGGSWSQRDFKLFATILDGDLNRDDLPDFTNYSDNSIRIVAAQNVNTNAHLAGCIIRGANGTSGGGMRNLTASPKIVSCIFEENLVSSTGAGIHNITDSHPSIKDCLFRNNRAGDSGGGITNSSGCWGVIENCTFESNWAKWGGGAIYSYNAISTLRNCRFIENSSDYWGGAVHNNQQGAGGSITDCVFENNFARDGGAIYNRVNAASTVDKCTFILNRATTGFGGAIFANHSSVTIDQCGFYSNQAGDDGGGVYANDYSTAVITNCLFSGNSSADKAGAVYIRSNSQAKIHHTTFFGNAALYGGGIYVWGTVTNCEIINSILWNNIAASGSQVGHGNNSYLQLRWTCLEGGQTGIVSDGTGSYYSESILDQNPDFMNPAGPDGILGTRDDDLRLNPGSTCIDSGNDALMLPLPWEDLAGRYRLIDGNCDGSLDTDRGAYEFRPQDVGSLDGNCIVNIVDLTLLIEKWLSEGDKLLADIAPLGGDGVVNLEDFSVLAGYWLDSF